MEGRTFIFRGDDAYKGGPVGFALGEEADSADIQDFAEHVLRKESKRTSRFVSFTEETKIARRFTSSQDNRCVMKLSIAALQECAGKGLLRIWDADQVYEELRNSAKKLARKAADVRTAMLRNREILIEGQIPEELIHPAD